MKKLFLILIVSGITIWLTAQVPEGGFLLNSNQLITGQVRR